MKVLTELLVLGILLKLGAEAARANVAIDAKRVAYAGTSNAGGSSGPPGVGRCQSFPVCAPNCVTDITGPCPKCDCSGYCDVNCIGDSCKIVRNGNACSFVPGGLRR
ncbi:uncharacterized protein TNIN_432241 [Trichonephila inaurata madagascariensis]|uniref:Uncharacterized protein n=1 Tax=Trichonephila inaurata madagascariensis TaxID=2747483 RepID=A0A8X6IZH6_9ARAC|nr:uncharacterized protein TNIN_432241 [Trichonephila inaurata madagascariensis]